MTDHVSDLLSPYVDNQTAPGERRRVEAHLVDCAACQAELAELRSLTSMLRQLPAQPVPRSFVIGPRMVRPPALRGEISGYLRAVSSIAAALAVVALGLTLIFQGLPRETSRVAAGAPFAASAPAPQAPAGAARAAQPAASGPAANAPAAAVAAARPAASAAASLAAQAPKPAASAVPVAAPPASAAPISNSRPSAPVDVPRFAGELLLLLVALGVATYSLRWWRR